MPVLIDIATFCKDRKISQKYLAEVVGTNPSFISEIANGRRKMPEATYNRLVDAFGEDEVAPYVITPNPASLSVSNSGNSCLIGGRDAINFSSEALEHLTAALRDQTALTREALALANTLQARLAEALALALSKDKSQD